MTVHKFKMRRGYVSRKIWGPDDDYLAVNDEQVFGLKQGDMVYRIQTDYMSLLEIEAVERALIDAGFEVTNWYR